MGSLRRLALISGSGATAALAAYSTLDQRDEREFSVKHDPWHDASLPPVSRKQQLATLRNGTVYDILVIGGVRRRKFGSFVSVTRTRVERGNTDPTPRRWSYWCGYRPRRTNEGSAHRPCRGRGLCQRNKQSFNETASRRGSLPGEGLPSGEPLSGIAAQPARCRYRVSPLTSLFPLSVQADVGQLNLVLEALKERAAVLRNAPHITNPLPTIMPCYRAWEVRPPRQPVSHQPPSRHLAPTLCTAVHEAPSASPRPASPLQVPYFWAGLKAYDLLAGFHGLTLSSFMSASETHRLYPQLAQSLPTGETLKGSVRDARRPACGRSFPVVACFMLLPRQR